MNGTEIVRERVSEFGYAIGLLTRLPVPGFALRAAPGADAVWAYPLVGALVGAIGGAVYWLLYLLSVPPALGALFALAAMIAATGAMHEDGIADFADGLAGKTREQALAIMRDHQLGTYGVIALILSLAVRATAVALIAEPAAVFGALIAAEATARLASVLVMAALPPARRDGLSAAVGQPSFKLAGAASLLVLLIAWIAVSFGVALLLVAAAGLGAVAIGVIALYRFGGQTGDVLGAASQLCLCLALTLLASL